jgi:hypothetical protein
MAPPNSHTFSDRVIGGVMQRIRPLHDQSVFPGEGDYHEKTPNYPTDKVRSRTTKHKVAAEMLATGEVRRAPKIHISAARRERCRVNQARYREKQRRHVGELSDNITEVQQEIQELESKRQELEHCAPKYDSVWSVATEFFQLFRHGYNAPTMLSERLPQRNHAQLDFLKATMASDVTSGSMSGAEALLEKWRLMSLHHSDTQVQLRCLNEVAKDSVLATATMSLTITEQTLRCVYPHLLHSESESDLELELSPLAAKLLNQRLEIQGSMRFDWDSGSCRIVRLESSFDILSAMLKLLGNLESVARVLSRN